MLQWNCDAKSTFKINIGSLMLERTKLKLYFKNLLSSPALAVQLWTQKTRRECVTKQAPRNLVLSSQRISTRSETRRQ